MYAQLAATKEAEERLAKASLEDDEENDGVVPEENNKKSKIVEGKEEPELST